MENETQNETQNKKNKGNSDRLSIGGGAFLGISLIPILFFGTIIVIGYFIFKIFDRAADPLLQGAGAGLARKYM